MKPTASIRWLASFVSVLKAVLIETETPVVLEHDKPLTFLVELRFKDPVSIPSIPYVKDLLGKFSEANEAHVLSLDIRPSGMRFVLRAERLYNTSIVNPLVEGTRKRSRR